MDSHAFKEEAIRRAEEAGYYPAEGQRPVDWDTVESWANKVQESDFTWKTEHGMGFDKNIIVGENNTIASGKHRILGGLLGNNPVPKESLSRLSVPLPTQPWVN